MSHHHEHEQKEPTIEELMERFEAISRVGNHPDPFLLAAILKHFHERLTQLEAARARGYSRSNS